MRQVLLTVLMFFACSAKSAEVTLILQDREGGYSGTRDTQLTPSRFQYQSL